MDYLLGRISTRAHDNIRLILSDETAYSINLAAIREVQFNDERRLEDVEWFCIERFSQKEYFIDYPFFHGGIIRYSPIQRDEYARIKHFIAIQEDFQVFLFQRVFTSTRIIQGKGIRYVNEHPEIIEMDNTLILNPSPDAIYLKDDDKLLFKDLSKIKPLFNGIEILFREATDEEVESFLNLGIVDLVDGFERSKVSIPNRRRISDAFALYNSFDDTEKKTLMGYMGEYCENLVDKDTSKVRIGTDENLKKFIYAIDQRFYSTPIKKKKRVATSVEDLGE